MATMQWYDWLLIGLAMVVCMLGGMAIELQFSQKELIKLRAEMYKRFWQLDVMDLRLMRHDTHLVGILTRLIKTLSPEQQADVLRLLEESQEIEARQYQEELQRIETTWQDTAA